MDGREVIGTRSELTRNHMEVRGIGIINVAAMFGVKSIRQEKRVDLVITLQAWNEVADVDRLGMEEQYVKVLGIDIPHRSEEHTSELQSLRHLVCRLLLEK